MKFSDLTRDQKIEVKQRMLTERLLDAEGRSPSYWELAEVDSTISDEEVGKAFANVEFVFDDFSCGAAADRDSVLDELKEWAESFLKHANYVAAGKLSHLQASLGIDWAREALLEHIKAVRV